MGRTGQARGVWVLTAVAVAVPLLGLGTVAAAGLTAETVSPGRFAAATADREGGADPLDQGASSSLVDEYGAAEVTVPFDTAFLAGQWYSEPAYGGAETYTLLGVDYDGVQRGGRAFWPGGYSSSPWNYPVTGGNEFPFLWGLNGGTLTLQFYSGRVETFQVIYYYPDAHELWVDDGREQRLFIGCRSARWPLPGATAPGC